MSFKKWMITLIVFMAGTGLLVCTFNVVVDPFGVFGDRFFNWYAYNMTNNPRVAKIEYLKKHHNQYDSYIVGCSKTSSLSTEKLNKYFKDARFYNMIMYGGDMYDIEKTVNYLIDHYKVKNIVVNMGLEEAVAFHKTKDPMKENLHASVEGSSRIKFYSKYLFLNPEYSFQKIKEYVKKSYLPNKYSVFDPETGVYNKIVRDREGIGNLDEYLSKNPGFNVDPQKVQMKAIHESVEAIRRMKEYCEAKGISFMLIASPVYYKEVQSYQPDQLKEYWEKIASVTDFWDFSGYNAISFESRYFYDALHFRNSVGDMALAYIFNDKSVYVPKDFGHKTTKDNVSAHADKIFGSKNIPQPIESYTVKVPILMYHHLDKENIKDASTAVTPGKFKNDMSALKEKGFNTVLTKDLIDYVYNGKELPVNPIMITFDDGYSSVYQYAYPLLKELGMKATASIIGISVGKDKYKDTDIAITPHFDYNQAREMYSSGVMDIQSHTFNMHDAKEPKGDYREDALQKKGESEKSYISFFKQDYLKSKEEIETKVGNKLTAYFYPHGRYSVLSEVLLGELGNQVSLCTQPGVNTVVKGLPQSLYVMKRINVTNDLTSEELINTINKYMK